MCDWLVPEDGEIVGDALANARALTGLGWWCEWYGLPPEVMGERLQALVAARRLAVRRVKGVRVYGPVETMGQVVEGVRRAMKARADGEGVVRASYKALGLELGVSPQDVWVAVRRLERDGWLECERAVRWGRSKGSAYRLAAGVEARA